METQPKPTWLSRLEEESWQAELVISGAAIFGTLQLPGLVADFSDYLLYTINRESMVFWGFIIMFLQMFAYTLIATFIFHFVLRTLWIGMIGVNSAFPGGFRPNKKLSEDYQKKLWAEFGDINDYIQRLDRTCSSIFGSGFALSMVAMGWATVLIIFGLFFYYLRDYLPAKLGLWVGVGIYVLVMVLAIFSMVLGTEKFKNTPLAHKYQFPISTIMSKAMYQFGYRPVNIITNIFYSNFADQKGSGTKALIVGIALGILSGVIGANTGGAISGYYDDFYHRIGNDQTSSSNAAYADSGYDQQVYHPVVPSREIAENGLFPVFIPLPNREYFELLNQCSIPEITEYEDRDDRRAKRRTRIIECGHEYLDIYLNDQQLSGYDLKRTYFGKAHQYGMEALLVDAPFKRGKNLIKVVTQYLNDDGEPRETYTEVYYLPKS